MSMAPHVAPDIDGYEQLPFLHGGKTYPVYRRGSGRPGVLVIHELPGMTEECLDFGRRLADAGFAVYLPLLFGTPGKTETNRNLLRLCVRREWSLWSAGRSSPVTDVLRALTARIRDETGHPRVGAIGMCLTGGFALVLMLDPWVTAPVVSQPSLPFALPGQGRKKAALDVAPADLERVRSRLEAEDLKVLGLRFAGDTTCPPERFTTLHQRLDPHFLDETVEGDHHSVLTLHFRDIPEPRRSQIWDRLVGFLRGQLEA
jgi:dienelactone hydrolase